MSKTGVEKAVVALATNKGHVEFDPTILGPRDVIEIIEGAGFTARLASKGSGNLDISHSRTIRKWKITFLFSLMFAIPTIIVAFAPIDWKEIIPGLTPKDVVLFLLSTLIQVVGGYQFYVSAFKSLRHCVANMDVLIALATTIAYVYSVVALLVAIFSTGKPPKTFFETPPMLIVFVALGRWLEHIAKVKQKCLIIIDDGWLLPGYVTLLALRLPWCFEAMKGALSTSESVLLFGATRPCCS